MTSTIRTTLFSRPQCAAPRRTIFSLMALYRQRRDLARLNPALLRDIGVTDIEARTEAQRPIWDAPEYWGQ